MKVETQDQANKLNLADASLLGIQWADDSNDLAINLHLSSGKRGVLTLCWFTDLKINLDFRDLARALTFEVNIATVKNGIWNVVFDFGGSPPGYIKANCNEVLFEVAPPCQ